MDEQFNIMAQGWERAKRLLSYTETQALPKLLARLNGAAEGNVVASEVAEEAGISRSVIVNALRIIEAAGLITTRSLGMKGTRIKVLYPGLFAEFKVQVA